MDNRAHVVLVALLGWSWVATGCSGQDDGSDDGSQGQVPGGGLPTGTASPGAGSTDMPGGGETAGAGDTIPMGTAGMMSPTPAMAAPDAGGMLDAGAGIADAALVDSGGAGPVVSDFPAVAIDDLTADGSFTAVTETSTGPGNGYNVYYPEELGRDGVRHPVLTWGNGATTTPDSYPLLPTLASQGFVVIAARSSFVNGAMLKDGLDWILEQNEVAGSEFEGMLDPEQVASLGYSLGSLATFEIGTDPRLKTTVHISGGIMGGGDESQATAVDVPTAYFCDKDQTGPNCDSDFAVVDDNPTFYARAPGHVHVDYMFDAAFIDQTNAAVIGWLRWQLMHDPTMAVMFEGADCTLCTDSAWEVQKKNMD